MRVTKKDEEHIKSFGEKKFERAVALASFEIRQDSRLTGLDKIREVLAFEAAMQATGNGERPLIIPRGCGEGIQQTQDICEELLKRAVESVAAKLASAA